MLWPFLLCLWAFSAFAQPLQDLSAPWRWVRFTDVDGLPANATAAVVPNAVSVPWVLTGKGLAWYDGFTWHPAAGGEGFPGSGEIRQFAPDHTGGLWVLGEKNLFRGGRDGFRPVPLEQDGRPIAPLRIGHAESVAPFAILARVRPRGLRANGG